MHSRTTCAIPSCSNLASSTKAQRQTLLRDLFNQYPLTVAQQAFYFEHASVDFESIWRSPVGGRAIFQCLCRTKFVILAYFTLEHRIFERTGVKSLNCKRRRISRAMVVAASCCYSF